MDVRPRSAPASIFARSPPTGPTRPPEFIVPVTAIVVRDGKFLIVKRADYEKAFPGKWTVPGGKFEEDDFF